MDNLFDNSRFKLTRNFSLTEFKVSRDHPVIAEKMTFTREEVLSLQLLCERCLQPLRDKFGQLNILSGKRSKELNALIGGSKNSDHLTCNAADIDPVEESALEVFKDILGQDLTPIRQVIYYPDEKFIHISTNIPWKQEKHEALVKNVENGRAVYTPAHEYFR